MERIQAFSHKRAINRRLFTVSAPILLLFQLSLGYALPVCAQEERLVLAFYYAWYDENTWTGGKVPDLPLSPYRSSDRATIERHVREARSAGIDALVQSWYGPGQNQTEANFATLLDVAQEQGLRATVDFETASPFMPTLESLVAGLAHLIDVHARHPAFLRYAGRPVVFFWQQQRLSAGAWASIRAQVDPDRRTIWIADGDDPAWLDVFDGLHMYNITWRENTDPSYTATKMRKRVDGYVADHGGQRFWVATAMPGYDDTHIAGRPHPYAYGRSPAYYRETWEAAMSSNPEMIVITSYNEWREGTMIEPSVTYGHTYLDLTRELVAQYKGAALPTPTPTTNLWPPMPTVTAMPMPTEMPTEMPTDMPAPTVTSTSTPTPTPTMTPTSTATSTPPPPTPTSTLTMTARPTRTPTSTASVTATPTSTLAEEPASTPVPPPTVTATPVPPATATQTPASTSSSGEGSRPPCLGTVAFVAGLIGAVVTRCQVLASRDGRPRMPAPL